MVVSSHIESRATLGKGRGSYLNRVEEDCGDDGEDEVDEEAIVRLETEDSGGDAEERSGKTLKI